jgi:DNA adenine methylase
MMPQDTITTQTEPFVKWAGGKRLLLPQILPLLPHLEAERRYFEPFLGGGAVYFALGPNRALLSDLNGELIETFEAVRDEVDEVIQRMHRLKNDEDCYYEVRSSRPRTRPTRAARFIYLNKTCFNGLFRVNLRGEFNVPFGRHGEHHVVCDEGQLRSAAGALQNAEFVVADFGRAMRRARAGDLVYLDPPYTLAHVNNGFIEYNARVFSWEDQRRLAAVARRLVNRGVRVAVSNGDHPSITNLYDSPEFTITRVDRWSTVAGGPGFRFPTSELLIVGDANREGV